MRHLNCTVVFNKQKDQVLFCKRAKEPFRGLYNFVGGKVEPGELSFNAAYRELLEETGIGRDQICLYRLMDLTYYEQDYVLEIYVGQLQNEVVLLREEVNPLKWLPLTEDFADSGRFAGEQNIAHIIRVALKFPLEDKMAGQKIDRRFCSIGIDGCKGGWITAVICGGELHLYKFASFAELAEKQFEKQPFDACLVDMVIGLQGNDEQIRPDTVAREILKRRRGAPSTVFPAPCRKAVYGENKEERRQANVEILHKKISSPADAIIPKMREVDEFLQTTPRYKNKILESHPEVCFARLNGQVLSSSKHEKEGIRERVAVIAGYLPEVTEHWVVQKARQMNCSRDDITDSVCLAIVANMLAQGKTETIPAEPMADDTGLFMQMVIPKEVKP